MDWKARMVGAETMSEIRKERKTQAEIDVSNLRFYAEMFKQHEWSTVVIHWGVFEQTLREIAERLEAAELSRDSALAEVERLKAELTEVRRGYAASIEARTYYRECDDDAFPL
jgi:hypothetical protein